jgi:hypothetical protein
VITLCHARGFFKGTNGSWDVGMKWKTTRSRRPSATKTEQSVEKISEIVRKDLRLSIRMIAEMVNTDKEMVRQILHDQLNMRKVCAKIVPKNFSQGTKRQPEKNLF